MYRAGSDGVTRRRVRAVTAAAIGGWVDYDFEPVLDAFAENFDERKEVGAAVCVYLDGRPVVDLWGGLADATAGSPWESDTVTLVYSSTKGVTSVCANRLIEQGRLDPDAPVREVLARVRRQRQGRDHRAAGA